jgi:N-methylhydantoinase A
MEFLERRLSLSADIRYLGQSFDLTVPVDIEILTDNTAGALRQRFNGLYEQVYGYKDEAAPLEILDVRASAVGVTLKPRIESVAMHTEGKRDGSSPGSRRIFLDGRYWEAQVFDRGALASGVRFSGPAIVEQYDTTTLIPHGFDVIVDRFGNLIGEANHAV